LSLRAGKSAILHKKWLIPSVKWPLFAIKFEIQGSAEEITLLVQGASMAGGCRPAALQGAC
jgi:hypothetical protein